MIEYANGQVIILSPQKLYWIVRHHVRGRNVVTPLVGNTIEIRRIKSIEGEERCRGPNLLRPLCPYNTIGTLEKRDGRNKLKPLHPLVPMMHTYSTPFSLFEMYCPLWAPGPTPHITMDRTLLF